jgi:monoamine oxidase
VTDAHGVKSTAVLIIGGGWTGVSAALELERLGIDYHLLEADVHRLGGRAFSYTYKQGSQEVCFDHGAQYIGKQQSEIWNLAQRHLPHAIVDGYEARIASKDQVMILDQKRYCYNRDECLFGIGGVPPDLDFWDVLASLLLVSEIQASERAINIVEPWNSPAWVQALDAITLNDWSSRGWIPPTARALIDVSVRSVLSMRPEDVSAFYFFWYSACNGGFLNEVNDAKDGPQQFYLSTGMGALIDKVAAGIRHKITFRSPVRSIDLTHGESIRVTTKSGERWNASKVIVAMSPNTAGKLEYMPALPQARKKLLSQPMGRTIKCQVFYKEPWWRDSHQRHYTGYAGGASRPVDWLMDNSSTPPHEGCYCLMAFIPRPLRQGRRL